MRRRRSTRRSSRRRGQGHPPRGRPSPGAAIDPGHRLRRSRALVEVGQQLVDVVLRRDRAQEDPRGRRPGPGPAPAPQRRSPSGSRRRGRATSSGTSRSGAGPDRDPPGRPRPIAARRRRRIGGWPSRGEIAGPLSASAMIHAWRRSSSAGTSIGSASASSCPITSMRPSSFATAAARRSRVPRARPSALSVAARSSAATATGKCAAPDRPFGGGVEERGDGLVGHVGRGRRDATRPGRSRQRLLASAAWARCRSSTVARCWIADRMSGWRKRSDRAVDLDESRVDRRRERRSRHAGGSHDSETPSRSSSAATSRSHGCREARSRARAANAARGAR